MKIIDKRKLLDTIMQYVRQSIVYDKCFFKTPWDCSVYHWFFDSINNKIVMSPNKEKTEQINIVLNKIFQTKDKRIYIHECVTMSTQ